MELMLAMWLFSLVARYGESPSTTFKALPGNLGSLFLACNLILTQLERRPPKKMEHDLKKK
jgi:hypothetical protein